MLSLLLLDLFTASGTLVAATQRANLVKENGTIPAYATVLVLVFVACLMPPSVKGVYWDDIMDYAPPVLTITTMHLTFSVVNGIGMGFVLLHHLSLCIIKTILILATQVTNAILVLVIIMIAILFMQKVL